MMGAMCVNVICYSGGLCLDPSIRVLILQSVYGWRKVMEGILFMCFWLGSAALHTFYDLKIKPWLRAQEDEQTDYPGF